MEALGTRDVLLRGGVDVRTVSITEEYMVESSHGLSVSVDTGWDDLEVMEPGTDASDVMIFPGGMPGSKNLAQHAELMEILQDHWARGGAVAAIVLFLLSCLLGWRSNFAFWKTDLRYEGESVYNYLQVEETEDDVILSTNVLFGVQSILPKNSRFTGMYYDYAMAAPYMAGAAEKQAAGEDFDLLVLGMGSGTYGSQCAAYLPGLKVEGVEIDRKITDLAREYFAMPAELPVAEYDGRAFLNAVDRKYDVIMVDAYQDITIPFQMASVEFFTLVREHLKDGGVMVVNMNMRGTREGNINQYLADTISAVFSQVWTVDVPRNTNRELFASNDPEMIDRLSRNLELLEDGELRGLLTRVSAGLSRYERGPYRMTDDKAPVELLSMQVIDELIRDEVAYYRGVYEQYGLEGLVASVQ